MINDKENLFNIKSLELAAYYNQTPIFGDKVHPRVDGFYKFCLENINENKIDLFIKKIKETCLFYPILKELSDIYNSGEYKNIEEIEQTTLYLENIKFTNNEQNEHDPIVRGECRRSDIDLAIRQLECAKKNPFLR